MGTVSRVNRIVVVGSGPAAAAAAITARRAGCEVIALSPEGSAAQPGETLHPGVEPLFRRLGVWKQVEGARFKRFDRIQVSWASRRREVRFGGDACGGWRGFQAPRTQLDALLWSRAESVGVVRVCERVRSVERRCDGRLRLRTGDDEWSGWVIDASGRSRIVANALGLKPIRMSPPLVARFGYRPTESGEIHPKLVSSDRGWHWTAPLWNGQTAWVQLDLDADTAPPSRVAECDRTPRESRGADVSWRLLDRCAGPGYFVAGDAASVLDPCAGHGVLRALMTGMYAAHLAVLAAQGRADPRVCADQYQRWLTRWWRHDAHALKQLYAELPKAPAWVGRMTRATAGLSTAARSRP